MILVKGLYDGWKNNFKKGLEEGYVVRDARQYQDVDENNRFGQRLEQLIDTPFTCWGADVTAYTDMSLATKLDGTRFKDIVELYIPDSDGKAHKVYDGFRDKGGNEISGTDVLEQVGDFSVSSSYMPHIMTPEEYTMYRNSLDKIYGKSSDENAYNDYLDNVLESLANPESDDIPSFVGKYTTEDDVDMLRHSLYDDNVADFLEEFAL